MYKPHTHYIVLAYNPQTGGWPVLNRFESANDFKAGMSHYTEEQLLRFRYDTHILSKGPRSATYPLVRQDAVDYILGRINASGIRKITKPYSGQY